jgi:hypothetical protein
MAAVTVVFKEYLAAVRRNDTEEVMRIMTQAVKGGFNKKGGLGDPTMTVKDIGNMGDAEFKELFKQAKEAAAAKVAAAQGDAQRAQDAATERFLRIAKFLENGECGAARQALSQSEGLREASEVNVQGVKRTYYTAVRDDAPPKVPAPAPPAGLPTFKKDEVIAYLNARKTKSADAWGWNARSLIAVINHSTDNEAAILDMFSRVMGGTHTIVDEKLREALLTFLGHCIPKGSDGVAIRPACSPSWFLQVPISIVLRKFVESQRVAIGTGQVGVAVPAGGEAYARAAQLEIDVHKDTPDYCMIILDITNYFNSVDKSACYNACASFEPTACVAELVYGNTKRIVVYNNKDEKSAYRFEAPNGTIQGLGLSGFCAAKAANEVVASLRAEYPDVSFPCFHDDNRISGRFNEAVPAFDEFVKRLKQRLGCNVGMKEGTGILALDPLCLTSDRMAQLAQRGIRVMEGFEAAGIPIGSDAWVKRKLNERVEAIRKDAAALVEVACNAKKHHRLSRKAIVNIMRLTLTSQFTHLLRCVPPSQVEQVAKRVDRITVAAALSAAGLGHIDPTTPLVSERALLANGQGGAGLGSAELTKDAAYIASWAATVHTVRTLVHTGTHIAPSLPIVQELDKALKRVQDACASKKVVDGKNKDELAVMGWSASSILDPNFKSPDFLQGTIATMLARVEREKILARLRAAGDDAAVRSFLSCGGRKAGNWLVSCDKHESTRMDDMQFTIAYALRLNVEPFADVKPGHKCRLCGKKIGTSGRHGALCTRDGTGTEARNERHYALNTEIARVLKLLDPATRTKHEPSIVRDFHKQPHDWKRDAKRRGDLLIRTALKSYIIDTSVCTAAAERAPQASNTKAGVFARQLALAKVVQYVSKFWRFAEHEIVAFCAEAEGTLDVGALDFVKARINDWWENSDQVLPKSVMASSVYARLSVALQRANADGTIWWRYTEVGEAVYAGDFDTVHAALNSKPRDLSECDRDLREEAVAAAAVAAADGLTYV